MLERAFDDGLVVEVFEGAVGLATVDLGLLPKVFEVEVSEASVKMMDSHVS